MVPLRCCSSGLLISFFSAWHPIIAEATFIAKPMQNFAEGHETEGIRTFSHSEHHMMSDGSEFVLQWRVRADPDHILSLDTDQAAGVRLLECSPNFLLLRIPDSHKPHLQHWRHVVASRLTHRCGHLQDHPLYHRIIKAEHVQHTEHGPTVLLATKELYSASDLLPHIDFTYHVRPFESMTRKEQETRRNFMAWRGISAEAKESIESLDSRRLKVIDKKFGNKWWNGDMETNTPGMSSNFLPVQGGPKHLHDLLNFTPLQNANFGWNWDFKLNTTKNPNYRFHFPGGKGHIHFRDPYLKIHAGLKIHFQSNLMIEDLSTPPHVQISATLNGNAAFNLDFSVLADFKQDVNMNDAADQAIKGTLKAVEKTEERIEKLQKKPVQPQKFHIPLLKNFTQDTYYFKPIEFFIANVPVRIQPGIKIGLDAFHLGRLKGSLRAGANTMLVVNGTVYFDSHTGVSANLTCEADNVKILTPTWLVFTRHFELGAALEPTLWLKGGIGPVKDMEVRAKFIPYFNVSVLQQGNQDFGPEHLLHSKQFVIYPFRAIGLTPGVAWAVQITYIVDGVTVTRKTGVQVSSGVIEFNDDVRKFHFGKVQQKDVLKDAVIVQFLRNGITPVGKVVKLYCETVLDGECHPSPQEATFEIDGEPVILQLTMAWQDEPTQFLLKKIRNFGLVFPQLNLTALYGRQSYNKTPTDVVFRFLRNGRTYDTHMNLHLQNDGNVGPVGVRLSSKAVYEMGPVFVENWHRGFGSYSRQQAIVEAAQPRVQLLYKFKGKPLEVFATGEMPAIPWDKDIRGTYGEGFTGVIPMPIELRSIRANEVVARGDVGLEIASPSKGAAWMQPWQASNFSEGSSEHLHWTLDVEEGTPVDFLFRALQVTANDKYEETAMVHMLPNKLCHKNGAVSRRFGDYGLHCIFSEVLKVQAGLVGNRFAFQVEWNSSGIQHKLVSAPVTFVSDITTLYEDLPQEAIFATGDGDHGSGDHQSEMPAPGEDVDVPMTEISVSEDAAEDSNDHRKSQSRRLFPFVRGSRKGIGQINYYEKLSTEHCDRQPLQYSVGYGIYFLGSIDNIHVPGMAEALMLPNWNNRLVPLYSGRLGSQLSKVVPKTLCDGGMCDGTLPGCSPNKVDPTIIPKVQFQLSRNFHFISQTSPIAKATIAYGMALSPALIEIAAVSLHKILETTTTTTVTRTEAGMLWFNGDGKLCYWKPADECVSAFNFENEVFWGCTKSGSISNSGWCSQDTQYTGRWKPCEQKCKKHSGVSTPDSKSAAAQGNTADVVDFSNCFFTKAPQCVPKFNYKGLTYSSCVQNPHDKSKAWCSDDVVFANRWHRCAMECPHMASSAVTELLTSPIPITIAATTPIYTTPSTTPSTTLKLTPVPTVAPYRAATPGPTPSPIPAPTQAPTPAPAQTPVLAPTATTTAEAEKVIGKNWECAHNHDLSFCKSSPSLGDAEYRWFSHADSSPCQCVCCRRSRFGRLLKDQKEEFGLTDSFVVHFHPDALIYKVDEALIQALIDRDAFRGLADGHEDELGEVKITGFKILYPEATKPHLQEYHLPAVCFFGVVGALLVSTVTFRFLKRGPIDYARLTSETNPVA